MEKQELAAGDSTIAEIIFKTGKYTGVVRKSASITTNAQSNSRLQIVANIIKDGDTTKPLMLEPMAVELDSIRPDNPDKEWKFKVAMRNFGEEKVSAHLVSLPTDLFEVKIDDKGIDPGKERYIEFQFNDAILEEMFSKSLTIELDDSAATRYTIPINKARRWGPTRHASK